MNELCLEIIEGKNHDNNSDSQPGIHIRIIVGHVKNIDAWAPAYHL